MALPVRRVMGAANKFSTYLFVIPWGVLESYLCLEEGNYSQAELVISELMTPS